MPGIDQLSEFWQGVVASVVGGIVLLMLGFVARISSSSLREWTASQVSAVNVLRQQLSAADSSVRSEANVRLLFNVLKWILIALLLFFLPALTPQPWDTRWFTVALRVLALGSLLVGLWWIFQYQRLVRVDSKGLEELIQSRPWRLVFNPPHRSKLITFLPDGQIGEGQNKNEYSWRLRDGHLELVQEDGRVHSRFVFHQRNSAFTHTNDADTLSIKGQYIIPEHGG